MKKVGANPSEAPEIDRLGFLLHATSLRSTFTLAISFELSPFAVKAMFWFCVSQSDNRKSYTQFWLSAELSRPLIPLFIFPFTFTTFAEQLPRFWRAKLSRARSSRHQIKLTKALPLPVGRYRRILPALRTNQIAGSVTVPSWKKINVKMTCNVDNGLKFSKMSITNSTRI